MMPDYEERVAWGIPLRDAAKDFCLDLESRINSCPGRVDCSLTLATLAKDELRPGEVSLLLSAPGAGATGLLLRCLFLRCCSGLTFWHSTLNDLETVRRLVAAATSIDLHRLETGWLFDNEFANVVRALSDLSEGKQVVFLSNTPFHLLKLQQALVTLPTAAKDGLLLILDDYLTLPSFDAADFPRVQSILRPLEKIVIETGIAIIAGIKVRIPSVRDRLATALFEALCSQAVGPILCLHENTGHLELRVRGSTRALRANIPLVKIPSLGVVDDLN